MTVTEAELAQELSEDLQCNHAFAQQIVRGVKRRLAEHLAANDTVVLTAFGKFHLKQVGYKSIRNPRTGARIEVQPSVCPAFLASRVLKAKCKGETP